MIDVNVPSYLSAPSPARPGSAPNHHHHSAESGRDSASTPPPYSAVEESTRLVRYLWDNYIELTDATDILLVSIGAACQSVVSMLAVRDVMKRVRAVINIYGETPLRALTTIEDSLIDWYYSVRLSSSLHRKT